MNKIKYSRIAAVALTILLMLGMFAVSVGAEAGSLKISHNPDTDYYNNVPLYFAEKDTGKVPAYCFNKGALEPTAIGTVYQSVTKLKSDGSFSGFAGTPNSADGGFTPRVGLTRTDIDKYMPQVLYLGYPSDGADLLKDMTAGEAAAYTQEAIWYFTDSYMPTLLPNPIVSYLVKTNAEGKPVKEDGTEITNQDDVSSVQVSNNSINVPSDFEVEMWKLEENNNGGRQAMVIIPESDDDSSDSSDTSDDSSDSSDSSGDSSDSSDTSDDSSDSSDSSGDSSDSSDTSDDSSDSSDTSDESSDSSDASDTSDSSDSSDSSEDSSLSGGNGSNTPTKTTVNGSGSQASGAKTGDTARPVFWATLIIITAFIGITVFVKNLKRAD